MLHSYMHAGFRKGSGFSMHAGRAGAWDGIKLPLLRQAPLLLHEFCLMVLPVQAFIHLSLCPASQAASWQVLL